MLSCNCVVIVIFVSVVIISGVVMQAMKTFNVSVVVMAAYYRICIIVINVMNIIIIIIVIVIIISFVYDIQPKRQ